MKWNSIQLNNGQAIRIPSEHEYAATMTESIEPELEKMRSIADIPVRGGTLHAENYVIPSSDRGVLLLHGYTESAEKFREVAWCFIQAGFSVFSYDHRGHGQSLRQINDLSISHVDRFDDYIEDCETFVTTCVRPHLGEKPLYLYAHSMGGAIGAHMLVEHPNWFKKAVLTSPMIAPSSAPFPMWVGRLLAATMCMIGKGKERAFIAGPFDPEKETFEASCSTGRARFDYYEKKRINTPYLQNCSPTYRWVLESFDQTKGLLIKEKCSKVSLPVLLCQAGKENLVRPEEQEAFVAMLPDARIKRFDEAKHEIYNSTDDVVCDYIKTILDFMII